MDSKMIVDPTADDVDDDDCNQRIFEWRNHPKNHLITATMMNNDINSNDMKQICKFGLNNGLMKMKNYPYFTIILRHKLPINMTSSNDNQIMSILSMKTRSINQLFTGNNSLKQPFDSCQSKFNGNNLINRKHGSISNDVNETNDFRFTSKWQIWTLKCSLETRNTSFSDWNIEPYGRSTEYAREFWATYQRLVQSHCLGNSKPNDNGENPMKLTTLMIFRGEIEPKWEDEHNVNGGRWFFDINYSPSTSNYHNQQPSNGNDFQQHQQQPQGENFFTTRNIWTNCMQLIMSGAFQANDPNINGFIINMKPTKYRISLWIRSSTSLSQIVEIGKQLRRYLSLQCQIKYELHTDNNNSIKH